MKASQRFSCVAASAAASESAAASASNAASSSTSAAASSSSSSASSSSGLPCRPKTGEKWSVNHIVKTNPETKESFTTILKFDHPYRMQRVMVVATPRFASEQFYKDWCYQPYVRDHQVRVSNDIFNPAFVAIPRIVLNGGKNAYYAGLKYFSPLYMLDAVDNNVTRRVFIAREQNFNTFVPLMMMTTNTFRDKWHPWIARKTRKMVGERYLSHPKEDKQSFVVLVPPSYAASMANTLGDLGFRVADSVEVPVGQEKPLKRLYFWGDFCLFAVLSYFWMVIGLIIVNESIRMYYSFREYQAHLIMIAGKDPAEYGYTEKEIEAAQEKLRTQ